MDKDYESKYHREEFKNWWFIARRDMLHRMFRKYAIPKNARILDIGCAGGAFLTELKQKGYNNVYALDYSADAIALCRKNGIEHAYVMDGHKPEFPEGTFDVIVASDSLEHLEDEQKALSNWHKVLKDGGIAIIYVPAYMFLWSYHDDINFHYRRYTLGSLCNALRKNHFKILKSGYWNMGVFLPTAAVRLLGRLKRSGPSEQKKGAQLVVLPAPVTAVLVGWMKIENRVSTWLKLPFGVSTYAVVRKVPV